MELCRPFTASAGDHFQERHAESLTGLVDDDDFAARDHGAVDDDVNRIADALVKRNDRAAGELMRAATGIEVEPSTTCTVTGIERIAPRLGGLGIASAFGASTAPGGSGELAASSMD